MKDIITLYGLGFEAVSPRGEHTPITRKFLEFLESKYKRIFTLFDNDGKHRAWDYNHPSIELPTPTKIAKDPSDHYHVFGLEQTRVMIDHLIKTHPMNDFSHLDLKKPRSRLEIEVLLDRIYLGKVIRIQHVGSRKVTSVCGKIHRIAMDFDSNGEAICIAMIDDKRYEFALPYFIQKALIQQQDGYTRSTGDPD